MSKTSSRLLTFAVSILIIASSFGQDKPVSTKDIELSVRESGSQVLLAWSIASDSLCTFAIERSSNGVHFDVIWSTKSKADCRNCHYTFTDKKPVNGNNYYRIRQTDENGTVGYSKTINEPFTSSTKPFKISTSGKRISIQCTQQIERILAWTSTGYRMVDRENFHNNNFSFTVTTTDRIIFLMMELQDGSRFTEKIGLE